MLYKRWIEIKLMWNFPSTVHLFTFQVKLVTGKTGSLSPKVTCLTLSTSRKWPNQRQRLDFVFRIIILFQLQIFCTVSCWRNAIYIIHEAYFDDYHSANLIHKYFRYVVGFLFDFVWLLSFWAFFLNRSINLC